MPLKPLKTLRIKRPTQVMLGHAKKMAIAKATSERSAALGEARILVDEAKLEMYKHAKELSEEMWKDYTNRIARIKKPSARMLGAREQVEMDFMFFSENYEALRKDILQRMTKRKMAAYAGFDPTRN